MCTLNVFSTAASIVSIESMVFRRGSAEASSPGSASPVYSIVDYVLGFCLVGVSTAQALQAELPPYLSMFQLLAFAVAIAGNRIADFRSGDSRCIPVDTGPLSKPETNMDGSTESAQSTIRSGKMVDSSIALLLTVGGVSWLWVLACTAMPSLLSRQTPVTPRLDLTYTPTSQLDIVISMYRESPEAVASMLSNLQSIPTIASLNPNIFIYLKDPTANTTSIQAATNATTITHLPNLGREGETYLYHITTHWHNLATHTLFLQADMHNPRETYPRLTRYFDPSRTGMLSLGFSGTTCDCNDCFDRWGWNDYTSSVPNVYEKVFGRPCQPGERVLLTYKGQFVASAARIKGTEKAMYEWLRQAMVEEGSFAHDRAVLGGRVDSLGRPFFGYTVERIWGLVLQCAGLEVAARCPTLLSGWRRGGGVADCQCMD